MIRWAYIRNGTCKHLVEDGALVSKCRRAKVSPWLPSHLRWQFDPDVLAQLPECRRGCPPREPKVQVRKVAAPSVKTGTLVGAGSSRLPELAQLQRVWAGES